MSEESSTSIRIQLVNPGERASKIWLDHLSSDIKNEFSIQPRWETSNLKSVDASQIDINTIILVITMSSGILTKVVELIEKNIQKNQTVKVIVNGAVLEIPGDKVGSKFLETLRKEFFKSVNTSKKRK